MERMTQRLTLQVDLQIHPSKQDGYQMWPSAWRPRGWAPTPVKPPISLQSPPTVLCTGLTFAKGQNIHADKTIPVNFPLMQKLLICIAYSRAKRVVTGQLRHKTWAWVFMTLPTLAIIQCSHRKLHMETVFKISLSQRTSCFKLSMIRKFKRIFLYSSFSLSHWFSPMTDDLPLREEHTQRGRVWVSARVPCAY